MILLPGKKIIILLKLISSWYEFTKYFIRSQFNMSLQSLYIHPIFDYNSDDKVREGAKNKKNDQDIFF